jgi:hypothetical protein
VNAELDRVFRDLATSFGASLVGSGANVLAYAAAHRAEYGKAMVMEDLQRLWQGVPTRTQLRAQVAADKVRRVLNAKAERAAKAQGIL